MTDETVPRVLFEALERKMVEAERRFKMQNETILRLSKTALMADVEWGEALRQVTEAASEALDVERASVWLCDDDYVSIRSEDLYVRSSRSHERGSELRTTAFPAYFNALESERVIAADTAATDPRTFEFTDIYLKPLGIGSMLDAPIRYAGRLAGVVCLEHVGSPRHWTAEELAFATSLADILSMAMASLERRRAQQKIEMQYLIARTLAEAASVSEAAPEILRAISAILQSDVAALWVIDSQLKVLRCAGMWSAPDLQVADMARATLTSLFTKGVGLPGRAWKKNGPVWVPDVAFDANFPRAAAAQKSSLQGAFAFPLSVGTEVLGVAEFFSRHSEKPSDEILALATATGSHIGHFVKRLETEERLKRTAEELAASNKDLEQFAYVASHDLQEPLRKIMTFADRLSKQCWGVGDAEKEYLDRMQKAAMRMRTLIEDLLNYSRITSKEKSFETTDLNQIVKEVLGDLEVKIQSAGARIEVTPLPLVTANPAQMRQLFQNLVSNALKFARTDLQPHVVIRAESLSSVVNAGRVRIAVEDNGIGFDEKYTDRIFKPFQRLHTKDEYEGTGIGLAVCQKIVDRHRGELTARSEPGKGATFFVDLPL